MADKPRSEVAADFQQIAVDVVTGIDKDWAKAGHTPTPDAIAFAQVAATIALGQRTTDLVERLEDRLQGIEDQLDRLNATIQERPV